jgi:uncharacterized glyoxalase superfamily protein PhnB
MSDAVVASEVEVAVDPQTAFTAFTDEIDLWWLRGPINNWDSARVTAMRCEHGVGGRLLEIYDEASGEVLELGLITAWEPGELLAWASSVDDVLVEVRFRAAGQGTMVRVEARIPEGGRDAGGTSFVRVTPGWFGAWCDRRDLVPHELVDTARLAVEIHYARPEAAARWLVRAFGLEPASPIPGEVGWIEFRVGNCSLIVLGQKEPLDRGELAVIPSAVIPWVFVDDLDAHFAAAQAAGATIVEDIQQQGYRAYVADDLEGHRWTFAQARPTQ